MDARAETGWLASSERWQKMSEWFCDQSFSSLTGGLGAVTEGTGGASRFGWEWGVGWVPSGKPAF